MKNNIFFAIIILILISGCKPNVMYLIQNTSGKEQMIEIVSDCPVTYSSGDTLKSDNKLIYPDDMKGLFKKPERFFTKEIYIQTRTDEGFKFKNIDSTTTLCYSHCYHHYFSKLIVNKTDTVSFSEANYELQWKAPQHIKITPTTAKGSQCVLIEIKSK